LNFWNILFRAWFYFRQGYNLYLAFIIGFASNLVVLFRLGISDNKYLAPLFLHSLAFFTLIGLLVAIPVGIFAGLYHMKRTGAFAADASVQTEANPYVYKVIGKEREVFLPLWVLTVKSLAKVLDQQKTMTLEERNELAEILRKADALLEGQYVGLPRRQGMGSFPITQGAK